MRSAPRRAWWIGAGAATLVAAALAWPRPDPFGYLLEGGARLERMARDEDGARLEYYVVPATATASRLLERIREESLRQGLVPAGALAHSSTVEYWSRDGTTGVGILLDDAPEAWRRRFGHPAGHCFVVRPPTPVGRALAWMGRHIGIGQHQLVR